MFWIKALFLFNYKENIDYTKERNASSREQLLITAHRNNRVPRCCIWLQMINTCSSMSLWSLRADEGEKELSLLRVCV